jgi:serralysin
MMRRNNWSMVRGYAAALVAVVALGVPGTAAQQVKAPQVCSTVLPEVVLKRLTALSSPEATAAPATTLNRQQQQNIGQATELALIAGLMWPNAGTLRIRFMDTPAAMQTRIMREASEWTKFANIKFAITTQPRAEIRISTVANNRSWSYIGMDATRQPQADATMNFGWLTPDSTDAQVSNVVLHEFGHALGAIHEHQSPAGGVQWNEPVVFEACADMGWNEQMCRSNILDRHTADGVKFTRLDAASIMMYAFPAAWTKNNVATPWNSKLSALDKQFIRTMYPRIAPQ